MYEMIKKSKKVNRPVISRHETSVGRNALTGNGIIQRTTNIEYYPGYYRYNYNPEAGGFENYVTVGKRMRAEIDPKDEKTGSSASGDNQTHMHLLHYLINKWGTRIIRGHLLNDHLGGLSIEENLFPISDNANKNHLNKVESYVKGYTYRKPQSGGLVRPERIVYQVEVFNSDDTQQFNEFNPQTKFCCDVVVIYKKNSGKEDFHVNYDVLSDISDNTSNKNGPGPFDAIPDARQSRNINKKWWPEKCSLIRLSGDGSNYRLIRRKNRKGAHTDSGAGGEDENEQKNMMGVVYTDAGPYVESVEGEKFETKIGWGKMVYEIYPIFYEQIPKELLGTYLNHMIEFGDSYALREMKSNNDIRCIFQTIVEYLKPKRKNWKLPSELYAQLCSTLLYNLLQDDLREKYDPIAESIGKYRLFQNKIEFIIMECGANIDQAESKLCELLQIDKDDRKDNQLLQLVEKGIQDKLLKDILLLLEINEENHSDAAEILIRRYGLNVLDYSPKDFSSNLWNVIKDNVKENDEFFYLKPFFETENSDWTNTPLLSAAIDRVIEMVTVEIQDMIIHKLTEVYDTLDFADISLTQEGYSLDNTILLQILEGKDSEHIVDSLIKKGLDGHLLGAASLGGLADDSLSRAAIRSFVEKRVAAQEKLVDNMLFKILYEYLKTNREPSFTDRLESWSESGKIDLDEYNDVYKVLQEYADAFFVKGYDEDADNIILNEKLVKNSGIMAQYITTAMDDFICLSSPLLGQRQAKKSAPSQKFITAKIFQEALPYFPLSTSRFNTLLSQMTVHWIEERRNLNPDEDEEEEEEEYNPPEDDDQAFPDGMIFPEEGGFLN